MQPTIQQHLASDCQAFVDVANPLSEEQFVQHPDDKWSIADVMQHLYLSARPVVRLMTGPREVLTQWGKADTPSRAYEEVIADYQKVLSRGLKAPALVSPRPEDMEVEKSVIVERFTNVYQTLIDALAHWSDQELNDYSIPHPALGKLTVREMLYFISVHTQHHLRLLPVIESKMNDEK